MIAMTADERLDRAFMALADPIRRRIVARLSRGSATVNELAEPFDITKQAVSKHIQVLESAGLVTRSRDAQRRPVHLDAAALETLTEWIDRYRLIHEQHIHVLLGYRHVQPGQRDAFKLTASLLGPPVPCMVHQDPPHGLSRG